MGQSIFFFYPSFLPRTFTNDRTAGERGGLFFNSSLTLPPASQTLRHQLGDYCRELTSAHSQKPGSNREPLFSKRKSLTSKLRTTIRNSKQFLRFFMICKLLLLSHYSMVLQRYTRSSLKSTLESFGSSRQQIFFKIGKERKKKDSSTQMLSCKILNNF